MALLQDYQAVGSTRFGRKELTSHTPFISMTQPLYWAAAGMVAVLASASISVVGANQDAGREYEILNSTRFGRPQLTSDVSAPYLPMTLPLFFGQDLGSTASSLDSVVLSAAGQVQAVGTLASTLDAVVLAASGQIADLGTVATTLDALVLAAAGTETDTGSIATTLDDSVLAVSGDVSETATFATTLGDVVLAAAGAEAETGTFATTLANVVLAAVGHETTAGSFVSELSDLSLSASGFVGVIGHLATVEDSVVAALSGSATVTGIFAAYLGGSPAPPPPPAVTNVSGLKIVFHPNSPPTMDIAKQPTALGIQQLTLTLGDKFVVFIRKGTKT